MKLLKFFRRQSRLIDRIEQLEIDLKIAEHSEGKYKAILRQIYSQHPEIHYACASKYARKQLFKFEDGAIVYALKNPDGSPVQEVECPL